METGKTKEWIEMDGENFYRFLASDEARGRRFVRIANNGDDECDVIYMEASDKDFRNWKANDNHQRYYRKNTRGRGYKKVSMSAHADEDGLLVEEVVASGDEMTEELSAIATSIENECGQPVSRNQLIAEISNQLEALYGQLAGLPGT